MKERKAQPKKEKPRNLYMDGFTEAYQRHYGLPYAVTAADGVQLDRLLNKSEKLSERMTLEVWRRGVENYFASDLGAHSLKHLCTAFVAYWKNPMDRFGKPREKASQVGGERPAAESYASWHPRFLNAAWKIAQKDKASLDAVEALFEVPELSEAQAFAALEEIERRGD
jgi:hypothetical protein